MTLQGSIQDSFLERGLFDCTVTLMRADSTAVECQPKVYELGNDEMHISRNVLGYYSMNNGRTVFIYRDGHTYVTKGYWVIDKLKKAGYQRGSLFVPFSNGEQIVDPLLAAKWESIW